MRTIVALWIKRYGALDLLSEVSSGIMLARDEYPEPSSGERAQLASVNAVILAALSHEMKAEPSRSASDDYNPAFRQKVAESLLLKALRWYAKGEYA